MMMLQQEKDGPKMLDEYCKDLCTMVKQGKIDPVGLHGHQGGVPASTV